MKKGDKMVGVDRRSDPLGRRSGLLFGSVSGQIDTEVPTNQQCEPRSKTFTGWVPADRLLGRKSTVKLSSQ